MSVKVTEYNIRVKVTEYNIRVKVTEYNIRVKVTEYNIPVKVTEYNIRHAAIRWQNVNSYNCHHYALFCVRSRRFRDINM